MRCEKYESEGVTVVQFELNQQKYMETKNKLNKRVNRIGLWAAIFTAVLAAAFIMMGMFGSSSWDSFPGMVNYVWSYIKAIDYVLFIPAFLLAPVFVVLMACIHHYAPYERKIYSLIGLAFAVIYAALITSDYFLLWTVILPSTINGETAGLSLLSMYNPHGIFVAMESLAYIMMGISLLVIAPVFQGGKIEKILKWIFISGFILAIASLIGIILAGYDIVIFEIAVIAIYCPVLIVSGALLSIIFRRAGVRE
jgi:hypothetical protein